MEQNPIGIRIHDLGRNAPAKLASSMVALGLNAGQLAIPKAVLGVESYQEAGEDLLAEIKETFEAEGIAISVLGCYIQPVCAQPAAQEQNLANFDQGLRCAAALGAACIGTETPLEGADPNTQSAFDALCKSVETMLEKAKPLGVKIALEPVRGHILYSPARMHRLLGRFVGENLGVIFDPLNLLAPTAVEDQEALWKECLDAFGEAIVACHIKDALPGPGPDGWVECSLGAGAVRYGMLTQWLAGGRRHIPLLREGFDVAHSTRELDFLRGIAGG